VEREALASLLGAVPPGDPFVFVDVGANTGLYSLWMLSCARRNKRSLQVLAIEPDEQSRHRLRFNISASHAEDVITVDDVAVSDGHGTARLLVHPRDRGSNRLADEGEQARPGRHAVRREPLAAVLARKGFQRPHAVKIDIEGGEIRVLAPYLRDASRDALPQLIIAEWQAAWRDELIGLLRMHGYTVQAQTEMNLIFALGGGQ
jgi:FkbM family methyltransferase